MEHTQKTALLLVIDAVGLSTLEYLLSKHPAKVRLPNLSRLGLGEIVLPRFKRRFSASSGKACAARVSQVSATADSLVGHREMMGVIDHRTYDLFNDGFSAKYLRELEKRIGR
ncbi:MAG: hypothetical protein M0011_12545, partial [Elusimicrobia bacterium]|nr:hypothetical protein [Elusimicrobiota bacterium]